MACASFLLTATLHIDGAGMMLKGLGQGLLLAVCFVYTTLHQNNEARFSRKQ
jgi:hypothetical protein